jgi:hypothetical protein
MKRYDPIPLVHWGEAGADMEECEDGDYVACVDAMAEIGRLRAAISNLIDAIQEVQCWQGTHVGACIDHACALLSDAHDQGRR